MARVRTVDFLPEIFQTDTNRQFLAATLDTLTQEPAFKKTQGFIGRTVGPGVIPDDRYVVELTKTRADYQLEPGIIGLDSQNTNRIQDAITYPGILDSISAKGGTGDRPDQLMQSEYYAWDPLCDFDTFVNFGQYYWLPNGPDAVDVSATGTPITDSFDVTRSNGVYTFSGLSGNNPTVELVRGGNYTFNIAQNSKETVNFRVSNKGNTGYTIDNVVNPTITLARGNTYVFNLVLRNPYPFWIKTQNELGTAYAYNDGVSRNGSLSGLVTFVVPQDAPDTLYYVSENQSNLRGQINIVDGDPGTGPGFWIQTAPGVQGRDPTYPNITSRDVFGVINNGEDLGTVVFNVPTRTQQQYFYNLPVFSLPVDLVTDLKISDIQGQSLDSFLAERGGIDGISNLDNRTIIFVGSDPGIAPPDTRQLFQISYNYIDNLPYLVVNKLSDIPEQIKWSIRYGVTYANTQWYKTTQGSLRQMPSLTAALDTLYYQDGTDPGIVGIIRLVEPAESSTIYINDMLGNPNYTSPNGVTFTNGLKVVFRGDVIPASYGSNSIEIICTGTTTDQNLITTYDTALLYPGQEIVFQATTLGGLVAGQSYYVNTVQNVLQFSVSNTPTGNPVTLTNSSGTMGATAINYREYYVCGVGSAISLLPVNDTVTPELYVLEETGYNTATQPLTPDYITIDRSSPDRNAWSRSNRWFHIDVIRATAEYNNTIADIPSDSKARRPIIQFRSGLHLYNMGTQGKQPVNAIDFDETDALSNIEGATSYSIYGYDFVNGTRVIFANDGDLEVRNKIYQVEFIYPDTVEPISTQPVIHLVEPSDGEVLVDQCVVILNQGTAQNPIPAGEEVTINGEEILRGRAGLSYWYNGIEWIQSQLKTSVQQAPLFDVYDLEGVSFGDGSKYPSTNFAGNKLFSYALNPNGVKDPVLGLALRYLTINNLGDIVFDNNLYADSFVYTRDRASYAQLISTGTPRQYLDRTTYQRPLGWQEAVTTSEVYQQFKFVFSTVNLEIDVPVSDRRDIPVIKIYVNGEWVSLDNFTYTVLNNRTQITLLREFAPDSIIEVLALSGQTSKIGFYQVPINLENNPFNSNSEFFTLGGIRQHYQTICENLINLQGPVNGANNTRDLGDIVPYGLNILQQSAPLTMAGYFLRSEKYNIFNSLIYNGREYTKYKNLLLENITQQTINFETPAQILDRAIENITQGRVETQPFYWSDMLPSGAVYQETVYEITYTTTSTFNTIDFHDYQSANYLGMDVYLDNEILVRGLDYTVATNGATITVLIPLTVGQTLTIREYSNTAGSFCPNTPTKMGLYPAWQPKITTQQTSNGEQEVIIGHDGSVTNIFGDIRDAVLLEFETRIYNNIKLDDNPVPLTVADVLPGEFRDTGYGLSQIQSILDQDFLSWVAWNKLNYTTQQYAANNAFTYNYSASTSRLEDGDLPGAWRGINRYFYDSIQPQLTPWEMLGFSVKPTWWDLTYGEAPYTDGNLVLWDDLEAGVVRDPLGAYVIPAYTRPGLTKVIPSGSEGQLLPPFDTVVGTYDAQQFEKPWSLGDGGPVEASWWNSSLYPFAVMRLLALTRPAKFFSLFADRDLYRYNSEFNQYLYQGRYRLDAKNIQVYGDGMSKASFINWIVDYNRQTGIDSTTQLSLDLANLDVRLCYRMASFSDKKYISLGTERSTPNSTNTGFLIPDNSYQLLLYKNQPFAQTTYSSVIVQKVTDGYQIFGYSTLQPYFVTQQSLPTNQPKILTSGGITVQVSTVFSNLTASVAYSTVYNTAQEVVQFLLGYGEYLKRQGFVFDNVSNGYQLDWTRMALEFLYWVGQEWESETLLSLNPLAKKLEITRPQAVVDSLIAQTAENILLDQNRQELATRNLNIVRLANTLIVESLTDQILSFVELNYTSYEHMIVLDNSSEFGDLIYDPVTGARQFRLSLTANNTTDWNGNIDAQGFILNQDNVQDWTGLRTYTKGEIVQHKGSYWSAARIVQPSTSFNFNDWLQSDYEQIEQGLLPNLANYANQIQKTYDINDTNLDIEEDLFSFGLIGFRPRRYLAALNLDDVSQVNVYRQFLGTKGTLLSVENLRSARLRKEQANYDVYENWAVQRGVYGANANRSFIELRLNRALLNPNPSTIQIINAQQSSQADQTVLLGSIWKQSYKLTSPDVFPTTMDLPTDTGLPSAGYVNLDNVDITVFDISDSASLAADLDQISVGTSVWVAKINEYDWGIFQTNSVPGSITHLCDNLDGTSLVLFTSQHDLTVGNKLIIRFFDTEVDGIYEVLTVPNLTSVTISFQFPPGSRSVIDGTGIGFTLETMRVAQFSDIVGLSYVNQLVPGARVWVDDDGSGRWAVYQKQDIYSSTATITAQEPDATEGYGTAVAMGVNQQAVLVGSPRRGFPVGVERGAVYTYVKSYLGTYQPISPISGQNALLELNNSGVRAYGSSVTFGKLDWAVAGAPASLSGTSLDNAGYACVIFKNPLVTVGNNPYVNWQLLTTPGDVDLDQARFGFSVAMSADERWMYIGAPGKNNGEVHAYTQVPWQQQQVQFIGDGNTVTYDISSTIQIAQNTQVFVTVNTVLQVLGVDYNLSSNLDQVIFTLPPADEEIVDIERLSTVELDPTAGPTYDIGQYFYQVSLSESDIYSFQVLINNDLARPDIDYTFDTITKQVTFVTVLNPLDNVVVRGNRYWLYVDTIIPPAISGSPAQFGYSVACTVDGRQVLIGAKDLDLDGQVQAGAIYVYDRDVQRFHYGETSTVTFTVLGSTPNPLAVSVSVNGNFLVPETSTVVTSSNTFAISGNNITVNTDLVVGDFVEIETNQFSLAQVIAQNSPAEFSNYGQTVDICKTSCSLYAGAPQSSQQEFKAGVVERNVNQSRLYGIITGTTQNPTVTPGNTLRVNNQDVAVPAATVSVTSLQGLINNINSQVPNVVSSLINGRVQISVLNNTSAPAGNKLQVAPGTIGTTFDDLGFETFVYTQTITSPYPVPYAQFGAALTVSDTAAELLIGAPSGSTYLVTDFDTGLTEFDAGSTIFFSISVQSGAVYVFNFVPAANASITNPDNFVLGQQIGISDLGGQDRLGQSLSYVSGVLLMGAPGNDIGDSSLSDYGRVYVWQNPTLRSAWVPIQREAAVVDIRLINSVFLYNLITSSTTEFLDFFNPLQGKILGAARQNIDFISAVDPAGYNAGPTNIRGTTWSQDHVGETWWNVSTVRFLDSSQGNITYDAKQWGLTFPGSQVDVYQWIVSPVPPANYTGPGTPLNNVSYSINTVLTKQGTFQTQYFFWVRGLTTVATNKGKTLSVSTVSQYIENPRLSGIAYLAPINASTVAIYNCDTLIEAQDTVLHIEFDRELNNDNVHVEYELIPQGKADGFLTDNLYRKMLDSFCGVDTAGNLVPDPILSPAEQYGVQFRPRQSMFSNRFNALKAYIIRSNAVLTRYPISEIRSFNLLNSQASVPSISSGLYNDVVSTIEILSFQNIHTVPLGYRYLVLSDSNESGLWTIYEVVLGVNDLRELQLYRVQDYRTSDYWSYINWYRPGYNSSVRPVLEVPNYAALGTISVPLGSSVKVTANPRGKFEIYLRVPEGWERVGLQDGTIEISDFIYDYIAGRFGFDAEVFDSLYFDQDPTIETRKILEALNQEIFIDELLIHRNELLMLVFDFVLSEFKAPQWLVKTSLIDVDHRIRGLEPFPNYQRDNQEFVIDYIQEVKPYHVQVREFNLLYDGQDQYLGDATDFDVPAYYNNSLDVPQYVSPILLPYAKSGATGSTTNINSDTAADNPIWTRWPWSQWYNNFLLLVDTVEVSNGGSGYTEPPTVTIQGDAVLPTLVEAVVSNGSVTAINITRLGSGYRDQPQVVFSTGNGQGAVAVVQLLGQGFGKNYSSSIVPAQDINYNLTRSIAVTLKFDRYQYQTTVQTWNPNGTYDSGELVRYDDRIWQASPIDGSTQVVGPVFDLENWTLIDVAETSLVWDPAQGYYVPVKNTSGVDRTMGLYVPGTNSPGLDLPLLVDGISYPGVQVWGDYFTGIEQLDAIYRSSFADMFLGIRPTDINVQGGQYIGPYEGHGPEELVNGSEFDTLDLRVYTRPGSDWQRNGHGFQIGATSFEYLVNRTSQSWAGILTFVAYVVASNATTDRDLTPGIDYEINWDNQTLEILSSPNVTYGDIVEIKVYGAGGGSQLYRVNYAGIEIVDAQFIVPVESALIQNIMILINGVATNDYDWEPYIDSEEWNQLQSYNFNAVVNDSGSAGPSYYRAFQPVPIGISLDDIQYWQQFTPTQQSRVRLSAAYTDQDGISVVVLGVDATYAGQFIIGRSYTITKLGNTNWLSIGANTGELGETFVATGVGSGTGEASSFYNWSVPQVQYKIINDQDITNGGFGLTNSMQGTNPANLVVTRNGLRLTPGAGIEWIGDGTTNSFGLPQRMPQEWQQISIIDSSTDIRVWVDGVFQTANVDYYVTNWDGSNTPGRQVIFFNNPVDGARILISLSTLADYQVSGNFLQLNSIPNIGDVVAVTSWNDTAQQNLLTQCFYGPVVFGAVLNEGFDSTTFDPDFVFSSTTGTISAMAMGVGESYTIVTVGTTDFTVFGASSNAPGVVFVATQPGTPTAGTGTVSGLVYSRSSATNASNNTSGSFDFSTGTQIITNNFVLDRVVPGNRVWATLDGNRLFEGQDFYMSGDTLVLTGGTINSSQILAVTIFTDSLVPEEASFRVFQDMRGVQATYRITRATTTVLTQPLSADHDVIYVQDVSALTVPDLVQGVFGVITIGGERITYRELDYVTQSVSGLRRGTAGTAADAHNTGDAVYSMGRGQLLAEQYQDYVVSDTTVGDGSTTVFYAPSVQPEDFGDSSSIWIESVEVYVEGQRQYRYGQAGNSQYNWIATDYDPLAIEFVAPLGVIDPVIAPPQGAQIVILQRRGAWWYNVSTTAARQQSLQENNSIAARFLTNRQGG